MKATLLMFTLTACVAGPEDPDTEVEAVAELSRPCSSQYTVTGAIEGKYYALGGTNSFLHCPTTFETPTPGAHPGAFNHFQGGSIYWSASTGAWSVHGSIRDIWARYGWEQGRLGFPLTDETATPSKPGAFNKFQGGSIYWSASTGAIIVRGLILGQWGRLAWEQGWLGFPIGWEHTYFTGTGVKAWCQRFQGGEIECLANGSCSSFLGDPRNCDIWPFAAY